MFIGQIEEIGVIEPIDVDEWQPVEPADDREPARPIEEPVPAA